jgi:predicted lipoprotein
MSKESWHVSVACVAVAALALACNNSGFVDLGEPSTETVETVETLEVLDPAEMVEMILMDVAPQVVRPGLDRFNNELALLAANLDAHAQRAQAASQPIDLSEVQSNWTVSTLLWQELELLQFGPAGLEDEVTGGRSLRSEIYSWPLSNDCRVDQLTLQRSFQVDDFHEVQAVNAYGLDTLEHLLFDGMMHTCPEVMGIDEDWAELSDLDIQRYRMEYAQVVVEGIQDNTAKLINRWSVDGGDYSVELLDGSKYTSQEDALGEVFHALLYLERYTLLYKLSGPIGVGCCEVEEEDCMLGAEHVSSAASLKAIERNVIGFERLWNNGDGFGFDEYFVGLGHADLSQEMQLRIDKAKQLLTGQEKSLAHLYQESPDEVTRIHDAITSVVELLDTEARTILEFRGVSTDCNGTGD